MNLAMYDFMKKMTSYNDEEKNIISNNSGIDHDIFKDRYNKTISFNKVVPDGKLISIRKHTRFIYYPNHSHDYVEICYVLKGKSIQLVEDKKVELSIGDLIFLAPGIRHEIFPCGNDDIIINFIIHPKFFSYIFEFINSGSSLSNFIIDATFKHTSSQSLIYKTKNSQEITDLLQNILSELDNENELTEPRIKCQIALLVLSLTTLKSTKIEKKTYQENILTHVISYIEKNLKTANLNEISAQLNLKNYNLSKLIKKESGVTFNNLLLDIRLRKFCEAIRSNELCINELAYEVGFSNTSSFYKKFKSRYGVSPKEFKMSCNKKNLLTH